MHSFVQDTVAQCSANDEYAFLLERANFDLPKNLKPFTD